MCRSVTRFTKGQARALSLYSKKWVLPYQSSPLGLSRIFPDLDSFVLEVGFGSGDATCQIAQANPHVGYIGVEVYIPGIAKLLMQIEKYQVTNIAVIQEDIIKVLKDMLPKGVLSGVHIFFPDPWHKRRHHKRRLIKPSFICDLSSCLRTGGYLHIITDCTDYADVILNIVESESLLHNPYGGFSSYSLLRPQTRFEMRGIQESRDIHEIYAVRS